MHGDEHTRKKLTLTKDLLKKKVDLLRDRIENNRLWFPVCKHMMWHNLVPDGNFNAAVEILSELYPTEKFNAKDLSQINVQSFRKVLSCWNETDAPVSGTTYNKYYSLALTLEEM